MNKINTLGLWLLICGLINTQLHSFHNPPQNQVSGAQQGYYYPQPNQGNYYPQTNQSGVAPLQRTDQNQQNYYYPPVNPPNTGIVPEKKSTVETSTIKLISTTNSPAIKKGDVLGDCVVDPNNDKRFLRVIYSYDRSSYSIELVELEKSKMYQNTIVSKTVIPDSDTQKIFKLV